MQSAQEKQLKVLMEEVALCRTRVLSDCELELGDSPRWKFFRARLLRVFGDRGLEGKISEIFGGSEDQNRNFR